MTAVSDLALMPEVFRGAGGDLVLCQEWPALDGELYVRVIIPMDRALELASAIAAAARGAGHAA
ncbi:hypothetical protein [Bradyrhizobium sp. JYMT SZCCT0428]|uniref:hypothetical protein n=1 Tax=Bradyrhizobium sp. JYMT SZCCT0428 TaxID=2807673 RepID=UPI001BACC688|nr:hypothetical protein [Bradyrhizobium sp. JYMT SZCCT0428]MBR1154181.1 hypothetical protein [Bradyrhizobium sp. JYMT SZCCT0428]